MAISIINTARHSLKFTSVQVISALVTLPINIYIATILVPEEYGNYGFLVLWLTYATLIGPGITAAGYREVPVLLGKGENEQALRIQNISITSDLLYSLLPFLVLFVASFFYTEDVLRVGLIIIAVSFAISRVAGYWTGVNFMRQNFNVAATGRLIIGVATPLIMLAFVNWLNINALLIAPVGAAAIAWLYFWRKGPINLRFTFDRTETLRLIKIGVVLQGISLVLWGFRLADRTVIASMLPTEQLGLYVYAMGFVMLALRALEDFGNVLQPILYREAGKTKSIYEGFKDTKRISVYIALFSALLIPLSQLVFYLVVNVITKNYIGSVPIFYALSYNLFLFSAAIIPGRILNSSLVNKQGIFLVLYIVGLALNIAFNILVVHLGYGVVGVAWVTIITQGLVTLVSYQLIKGYIFTSTKEFILFLARILIPFLATIPFYFIHDYLGSIVISKWKIIGISLGSQVVIWGMVIGLFYREYVSLKNIKTLIAEITSPIKNRLPGDKR